MKKKGSTETIIRGIEDVCLKPDTSIRGIDKDLLGDGGSSTIDGWGGNLADDCET